MQSKRMAEKVKKTRRLEQKWLHKHEEKPGKTWMCVEEEKNGG